MWARLTFFMFHIKSARWAYSAYHRPRVRSNKPCSTRRAFYRSKARIKSSWNTIETPLHATVRSISAWGTVWTRVVYQPVRTCCACSAWLALACGVISISPRPAMLTELVTNASDSSWPARCARTKTPVGRLCVNATLQT